MRMADELVKQGFRDAGYEYVNVDDCWTLHDRDAQGKLQADPERFPSGIKALADYMHQRGLKLGIYGDAGTLTCGGYPGSFGNFTIDAQTFADWDVDMLKLDGCYLDENTMDDVYPLMTKALNATGRPILYSCSWPAYQIGKNPNYARIQEYCNIWRNYDDIDDSWDSVKGIVDWYVQNQDVMIPVSAPGSFNDPDMIIVGNYGLSLDQSRVQMALWAIFASPLFMSNDLSKLSDEHRDILLNKFVLAINQDENGIMGRRLQKLANGIEVYRRIVSPFVADDYSVAIAFVNRNEGGGPLKITVEMNDMDLISTTCVYVITDLFDNNQVVATLKAGDTFTTTVNPAGVQMYKATAVEQ